MSHIQIAVDGPASSGKSTVAKAVSNKLGISYIDTGAMYRAVTLAALNKDIDIEQQDEVVQLLAEVEFRFVNETDSEQRVLLNDQDVTQAIRSQVVSENVSLVSSYEKVRAALVSKQQNMAQRESVIMDGRDIGTVVLPFADYKFFLNADARVRAKRRYEENIAKGLSDQSLEEVLAAVIKRDEFDSNREHSPLRKAEDAIEIDTSHLSINEVVEKILKVIS